MKMPLIDVEKEFDLVVDAVGGARVDTIVGKHPNFENADYFFDDYGVIAELKCLSKNQLKDKEKNEELFEIYSDALEAGQAEEVLFGTGTITSEKMSPKFSQMMGEVYRKPVQRVVKKANKQIRETKKRTQRPDHLGLLILVNDENKALDPVHIKWILNATLRDRNYSSINSVLFFTANLFSMKPNSDTGFLVWVPAARLEFEPCSAELLDRLREKWIDHYQKLIGFEIDVQNVDVDEFRTLRNPKK